MVAGGAGGGGQEASSLTHALGVEGAGEGIAWRHQPDLGATGQWRHGDALPSDGLEARAHGRHQAACTPSGDR